MKKLFATVFAACFLASGVSAAPRKHFWKDPKWWVGEAIIAGAIVADAHSTATRPPGAIESNIFLGRNPSNAKIAGLSLLDFGIQTTLHASAWHVIHHEPIAASCTTWILDPVTGQTTTRCTQYDQDNLFWRSLAYGAVPAETAILNGHAAARNYQLK